MKLFQLIISGIFLAREAVIAIKAATTRKASPPEPTRDTTYEGILAKQAADEERENQIASKRIEEIAKKYRAKVASKSPS